jgi:hypothetical protein
MISADKIKALVESEIHDNQIYHFIDKLNLPHQSGYSGDIVPLIPGILCHKKQM